MISYKPEDRVCGVCVHQVHWNNPDRASHFTDSSGLVIHYTPNLRRYDAGILVFGHVYLQVSHNSWHRYAQLDLERQQV